MSSADQDPNIPAIYISRPSIAMAQSRYATYPSLRDKVVIVTGGAEGIGGSAVEQFAHQGCQTIILDISESSALKLISKCKTAGAIPPAFYECDVTDLQRLKEIADDILKKYERVDVLVNNAASSAGKARVGTMEVTEETFQFNIDVNLRHQFFLTQYLVPSMKKNGGGRYVLVRGSSVSITAHC